MLWRDGGDLAQQRRTLHGVAKLPDVAGPRVLRHRSPGVGAERLGRQPVVDAGGLEERVGEQHEVAAPRPQGGQGQGDDGKAVIQVFAERALTD